VTSSEATHPGVAPLPLAERAALIGALALIALIAWAYLALHAGMPAAPEMADGMAAMPQGGADYALLALMWVVMMAAMMLPTVVPAVLVHAAVSRNRVPAHAAARNAAFIAGYAIAWSAFALGAAALQLALGHLALLSADMRAASPYLGAALLALAGAWQLTPVKEACLRKCRMPLAFIAEHWREGAGGALGMGLAHGGYCIGCCAALMALLFVGGVMNLLWVALIAGFVLLEKTTLPGTRLGRLISGGGLLLAAAGVVAFG
jgi:predicted metal-binding membrane protein